MKISIAQALRRLPAEGSETYPQGEHFITMLAGGTMRVEVFAPKFVDKQLPHEQDELYFIQVGMGQIDINGQKYDAAAGDAFFVAAGVPHFFENFSDDFVTWVVFYGPIGGE